MIRFIDLRGQGTGNRFAFFDTVRDRFIEVGGDQVWASAPEFIEAAHLAFGQGAERFIGLMPQWVAVPPEEDDDL
jgi:hypothetical protein